MYTPSLKGLESAFAKWRGSKRYVTERVPSTLLQRARHASDRYGVAAVVKVTGLTREQIINGKRQRSGVRKNDTPAFSRVAIAAPNGPQPVLEAEIPSGLKVRLFAITPETTQVLSSLTNSGGGQ
jgi:hypothetical protein